MDRLIEEGRTSGIEKAVMNTFPHFFAGAKGNKTGMLGRWKTQCDKQNWRQIPWERLSNNDRQMKELPDWIRLPMGLLPRAAERFKEGGNVPPCITNKLVSLVDRITTGGEHSKLTGGNLNTKEIKKEAERLLSIYRQTQAEYAEANGKAAPPCKEKISDRWVNRFLAHFGWRRRTPNTYGAYLAYDDERMEKSRKMFQFRRWGIPENMHTYIHIYIYIYIYMLHIHRGNKGIDIGTPSWFLQMQRVCKYILWIILHTGGCQKQPLPIFWKRSYAHVRFSKVQKQGYQ